MDHVKRHWKKYALTGAGLVAAYYGIDPETAKSVLVRMWSLIS